MSNSDTNTTGGSPGGGIARPRAVIHKKILEAAESSPNASFEALADGISGASPDLVERVLDEYGDPGSTDGSADADQETGSNPASDSQSEQASDDEHDDANGDSSSTAEAGGGADGDRRLIADGASNGADLDRTTNGYAGHGSSPSGDDADSGSVDADEGSADADIGDDDPVEPTDADGGDRDGVPGDATVEDLDETERAILREVARDPAATQAEIADALDVSRATVSRRVNDVDGLEWSDRREFVDRAFDGRVAESGPDRDDGSLDELAETVEALTDAVADVSDDVAQIETGLAERSAEVTDAVSGSGGSDLTDESSDGEVPSADGGAGDAEGAEGTGDERALADPELAHKVIHACVDADYVSESEELRIVRAILDDGRSP